MLFLFSEVSDDTSEMDEGKRPQEPPSTPPRLTHGKGEGLQVSQYGHQEPKLRAVLLWVRVSQPFFHYHCPFRFFFLIINPTPQDISIPQVYCISISVLDIFICAFYIKRVSFFHPQEPILGQLTTAKYSCSKYIHGTLLQCQAIQVFPKIPISMFLTWPFCENWDENSSS